MNTKTMTRYQTTKIRTFTLLSLTLLMLGFRKTISSTSDDNNTNNSTISNYDPNKIDSRLDNNQTKITKPSIYLNPTAKITAPDRAKSNQAIRKPIVAQPRIIGGTPVSNGKFPSMAFSAGSKLCGGTLIYDDIILTAAHCKADAFADGALVGGTKVDGSESTFIAVVSSTPHPQYHVPNANSEANDYMLVKLEKPATGIPLQPWNCDNPNVPADTDTLTVIGYGNTAPGGTFSDVLLGIDVPVISTQDCIDYYGPMAIDDATMFCAGVADGSKDSCQGDSGGPVFNCAGVQVGITSFADGCATPGVPGVYSQLSGASDFILQGICDLSSNPPACCSSNTCTCKATPANCSTPTKAPVATTPAAPTKAPTKPVAKPTTKPVKSPTKAPAKVPTKAPVKVPTKAPVKVPTKAPVKKPTTKPVAKPIDAPVAKPSISGGAAITPGMLGNSATICICNNTIVTIITDTSSSGSSPSKGSSKGSKTSKSSGKGSRIRRRRTTNSNTRSLKGSKKSKSSKSSNSWLADVAGVSSSSTGTKATGEACTCPKTDNVATPTKTSNTLTLDLSSLNKYMSVNGNNKSKPQNQSISSMSSTSSSSLFSLNDNFYDIFSTWHKKRQTRVGDANGKLAVLGSADDTTTKTKRQRKNYIIKNFFWH